jgi:hypothetical protein
MLKRISIALIGVLLCQSLAFAGESNNADYVGGTTAEFKDTKKSVHGRLDTKDETALKFFYNKTQVLSIPYDHFIDMEFGLKSGRRVGAAVATTILLGPLGLLTLMSKKQKHFLTLGYKDNEGKDQVAIFQLDKDVVRTMLPILETRSGKKITYQSASAEKKGTGRKPADDKKDAKP